LTKVYLFKVYSSATTPNVAVDYFITEYFTLQVAKTEQHFQLCSETYLVSWSPIVQTTNSNGLSLAFVIMRRLFVS